MRIKASFSKTVSETVQTAALRVSLLSSPIPLEFPPEIVDTLNGSGRKKFEGNREAGEITLPLLLDFGVRPRRPLPHPTYSNEACPPADSPTAYLTIRVTTLLTSHVINGKLQLSNSFYRLSMRVKVGHTGGSGQMEKRHQILLVDDSKETVDGLKTYLDQKYEVFTACNGLECLRVLEKNERQPDLVITDLVMPLISGIGLISLLKKQSP